MTGSKLRIMAVMNVSDPRMVVMIRLSVYMHDDKNEDGVMNENATYLSDHNTSQSSIGRLLCVEIQYLHLLAMLSVITSHT